MFHQVAAVLTSGELWIHGSVSGCALLVVGSFYLWKMFFLTSLCFSDCLYLYLGCSWFGSPLAIVVSRVLVQMVPNWGKKLFSCSLAH